MDIEITNLEVKHDGFARFLIAEMRGRDGGTVHREIEDHGRAVSVLPYDPARRHAILIRQFRAPVFYASGQTQVLEAIAGLVEGPDPAACARREALEEAGLMLNELEHISTGWSMPGISTERMDLYLAPYRESDRVGPGGGLASEHEDITVVEVTLKKLAEMADRAEIADIKALLLIQTLRLRHPELF